MQNDNQEDEANKKAKIVKTLEEYSKTTAPYHDEIVIDGFERRSIFPRDYPHKDRRKR